jgi:hypothetical protein
LPQLGSTVAFSSTQITALLTAGAGVIIFSDKLNWLSGFLGVVSAGAAVVAAIQAGKETPVSDVASGVNPAGR